MATSTARTWALFKLIRVLVYTLSIVASLGFSIIYGILLVYGWASYRVDQRVIVTILLSTYAVSTITLFLMLIFRFRLWLDFLCLVFLILFQVGGTVTFALSTSQLPCTRFGSPSTCKLIETIVIIGGYALTGVGLVFAFYLAAMYYVPVPAPRVHPEALLVLQLSPKESMLNEKREKRTSMSSVASAGSVYSQRSDIMPYPYTAPPAQNTPYRTPSPSNADSMRVPLDNMRSQTPGYMHTGEISSAYSSRPTTRQIAPPFEHYRSVTPAASMRSVALTSASSIRTVPRQRYYNNNGIPAPQASMAPGVVYPMMVNPLTQAFFEPISRHGTPISALSNTSFYMPEIPHQRRQHGMMFSPSGLAPVGEGLTFPRPPSGSHYGDTSPKSEAAVLPYLLNESRPSSRGTIGSPPPIAMQMSEALRMRSPSPSIHTLRSVDSFRSQLTSNGSISSIPRSPSPETVSFHSLATTPRSDILPARPDMAAAVYNGRYGTTSPDSQHQRYGSVPDIGVNDVPASSNQQYYQQPATGNGNNYRGPQPTLRNDWVSDGKTGEINSWRQDLVYNSRGAKGRR